MQPGIIGHQKWRAWKDWHMVKIVIKTWERFEKNIFSLILGLQKNPQIFPFGWKSRQGFFAFWAAFLFIEIELV